MKKSIETPDVWESHGAGVESLAASVEEDGLPYSLAMGELLRSLLALSQTLSRQPKDAEPEFADHSRNHGARRRGARG